MDALSKSAIINWLLKTNDNQYHGLANKVTRYQEGHAPLSPKMILRLVWQQDQVGENVERWLNELDNDICICLVVRPTSLVGIELQFSDLISNEKIDAIKQISGLEVFNIHQTLPNLNEKGLLVMDMDSTAIQIECIDELAKIAGVRDAVSVVTEQAMSGKLDFTESLALRVEQLKDVPATIIDDLILNLPLTDGLELMCAELKKYGWELVLASGGFTPFVDALKHRLNLTAAFANTLEIEQGLLTGKVIGEVVDAQYKADVVSIMAECFNVSSNQTLAIGDGANDIPMIKQAAVGISFHAKPIVNTVAQYSIKNLGLDSLLYLLEKKCS